MDIFGSAICILALTVAFYYMLSDSFDGDNLVQKLIIRAYSKGNYVRLKRFTGISLKYLGRHTTKVKINKVIVKFIEPLHLYSQYQHCESCVSFRIIFDEKQKEYIHFLYRHLLREVVPLIGTEIIKYDWEYLILLTYIFAECNHMGPDLPGLFVQKIITEMSLRCENENYFIRNVSYFTSDFKEKYPAFYDRYFVPNESYIDILIKEKRKRGK